jgi:hypothetical protein
MDYGETLGQGSIRDLWQHLRAQRLGFREAILFIAHARQRCGSVAPRRALRVLDGGKHLLDALDDGLHVALSAVGQRDDDIDVAHK